MANWTCTKTCTKTLKSFKILWPGFSENFHLAYISGKSAHLAHKSYFLKWKVEKRSES